MAKKFKKIRHDIAFFLISFVVFFTKICPRFLGLRIFGFVGFIFGFIMKKERNITRENLKKAFPDYSAKKIEKITNGVFINSGLSFFDGIKLPEYSKEKFFKIVRWADENEAKRILDNHEKGIVSLTAHVSCFEVELQAVALAGYPVFAVGTTSFDERIDKIFTNLRKRNGAKYFTRDGSVRTMLELFKKGYVLGTLIDQDATHDGVFVDFFGEEAFTPSVPVKMALKLKIPMLWGFIVREKGDKYVFHIEDGKFTQTGDLTRDCVETTQLYTNRLCEVIKEHPEQWVWMHRRWRRKAKDYPPELSISHYKKGEE